MQGRCRPDTLRELATAVLLAGQPALKTARGSVPFAPSCTAWVAMQQRPAQPDSCCFHAAVSRRSQALVSRGPLPPLQVFTSITPAWNNENLNRLATKLESGVIFAHVRAAYPGMPVSEQNCE